MLHIFIFVLQNSAARTKRTSKKILHGSKANFIEVYSRFSQTHNIGNNANIGIRDFTTWKQKKNSNKILPPVSIEPLTQVSKSSMLPLPYIGTCYLGDL